MVEKRAEAAQAEPPSVTVTEITDPTAAREGVQVLDQDVVQLEDTPFQALRVVVRLTDSVVVFHSTNRRLRARTKVRDDLMAFLAIGLRAEGTLDGLTMRPDGMLVVPPGAEGELVVEPGYSSVTFLISPTHLAEHLRVRGRNEELPPHHETEVRIPNQAGVRSFYELGRQIAELAQRRSAVFNESEPSRTTAEGQVLETLLSVLNTGATTDLARGERTKRSYSKVIKAAEAHAIAHVGEPLYVTDLCRAAHVSERTLQYAFRKILGLTPMAYLTRLKLHRVRQALRVARYGSTTVSAEAIAWGFWHFGDFSRLYKEVFGERPSDTLKRPRTAPP